MTPAAVRIDDLLDPHFPEGVGHALDAIDAGAEALDWSPDAIRREAVAVTGLDGCGAPAE